MTISSRQPLLFLFLEIFEKEGGIQTYNKDIFREYVQLEGVPEADIFLLRDRKPAQNPFERPTFRFHYFYSRRAIWSRLWFSIAVVHYVLTQRPQRVICGHLKLAQLTQIICQLLSIPYTVMTHGKEVWERLPDGDRHALANADQIWTVSRYTRDRACQANQINPNTFKLVPCSVDGSYFTPGDKSSALIQKYQLQDAKVLLTVARLWSGDRYKGVDVTIQALPQIAAMHPTVKYLVIGRGDDQPRLKKLAHDMGVGDRVTFTGFVPTSQLVEYYRLANGYVMPSQEGFGIVYLEALACGVPVVAGDHDGAADPLQGGLLGWHVPHRDPDAVARACIALLNGHDKRCHSTWLREKTVATFDRPALRQTLQNLLTQTNSTKALSEVD